MKKRNSIKLAVTITSTALFGFMPQIVHADIEEDVTKAHAVMKQQNWAEGKALLDRVVKNFADKGKARFGGKFGTIYYDKGFCELQLGSQLKAVGDEKSLEQAKEMFTAAKESFNACRALPTDKLGVNAYYTKSLITLGNAEQALEEFQAAIDNYKKFMVERNQQTVKDGFHIGMYNINLAICHFRLEKPALAEGITYYETALNNKEKMRVPDAAIVSAFKDFASAAIVERQEKMLVDFVNNNRGLLTLDHYQMYQFTPFFRKYAAEAFSKQMVNASFTLYGLMPGTLETLEDLSVYDKDFVGYKHPSVSDSFIDPTAVQSVTRIQEDLAHVQKSISDGEPHELLALRTLAFTHETQGYSRGAYMAYKSMEHYYPKSKGREDNLFNLVRTSALVGEVMETEKFGNLFLKKFPESKYVEQVKNMMLISLFYSGEYEVSLKVATELIEDLKENTKPHDLCLHVLGGSMFYLGRFFEAEPLLKKHVEMYKDSDYKIAARYFEASNYSRMQNWAKAATLLDAFLTEFSDPVANPYIPFALYDRANTHFANEEYKEAIAKLDQVEKNFIGSAVDNICFILRGDVHRVEGEKKEANDYYIKGLELSKRQGVNVAAEEALYKLVSLHGAEKEGKENNPNIKDAVPFYDEFWKDRQKSPYKTQLAVAGVPALMAAGRGDEALANVQSVITEMAKMENAPGMEEAINTYGRHYLASEKTPEQLKEHFEDFPGIDAGDKRAQALLRIAVIGVYEKLAEDADKPDDPESVNKVALIRAKIDAMFNDMDQKFKKDELSDFILIRLADFIAGGKVNGSKALPYYDEVLKRNTNLFRVKAQFGKAGLLVLSDDAAEQKQALDTLKEILATKDVSRDTQEKAYYNMIVLFNKQKNWEGVKEQAVAYNTAGFSTKNKAQVSFLLGIAYENLGDKSNALGVFAAVFARHKGDWAISIPALTKATEFTIKNGKEINGVKPKQIAYDLAAQFIRDSSKAYEDNKLKMPADVRKLWEDLRDTVKGWETDPEVKSLEKQKKEREAQ